MADHAPPPPGRTWRDLVDLARKIAANEVERRELAGDAVDDVAQEILLAWLEVDGWRFDARGRLAGFLHRRARWAVGDVARRAERLEDRRAAFAAHLAAQPRALMPDDEVREALWRWAIEGVVAVAAAVLADAPFERAALIDGVVGGEGVTAVAARFGLHASQATRAKDRACRRLRWEIRGDLGDSRATSRRERRTWKGGTAA